MFDSKKHSTLTAEKRAGQMTWILLVVVLIFAIITKANSQVLTETLATGGVLVNSENGLDNLISNPARLSFSGFSLKLGGLGFTIDGKNNDFFNFIDNNSSDLSNWSNLPLEKRDEINDEFKSLEDKRAELKISPALGIAFKKFAIAAYATSFVDLELVPTIKDDSEEQVELKAHQNTEAVVMIGISNELFNRLALGISAQFINRWENKDNDIKWNQASNMSQWFKLLSQDKKNVATGYAVGAGACLRPLNSILIEYAVDNLLFDLGDYDGKLSSYFQISKEFSRNFLTRLVSARNIRIAGQFSSADNAVPEFNIKEAAAGIELTYPLLKLRGGINHNRYSYGANLNLAILNIGYACQIVDNDNHYHSFEVAIEF